MGYYSQQWYKSIEELVQSRGMSRPAATRELARVNPQLREKFVAEFNVEKTQKGGVR
jgi:hypothetical protein